MKIGISAPVLPRYCRLRTGSVATARRRASAAFRRAGDRVDQIRSAVSAARGIESGTGRLCGRGLCLCGLLCGRGLGGLRGLLRRLPLLRCLHAELLVEPLDAALGVDQLLPAREERVAGGADFEMQIRLGRARLERVAARTAHLDLFVLGVNPFLHDKLLATLWSGFWLGAETKSIAAFQKATVA